MNIDRLPHQPPMRWIYSASRISEQEVTAEARLPRQSGIGETTSVLLGLEILAQAGAVLLAHESGASNVPAEGRLLHVREAKWTSDLLPVETPLEAKVERLDSSAIGLHRFRGALSSHSGGNLLEAEFSLLVIPLPL